MSEYTCALCRGTFAKIVSDEDANAEAKKYWGVQNASERPDFVVVCDDCFQDIHPEKHPQQHQQARKKLIRQSE